MSAVPNRQFFWILLALGLFTAFLEIRRRDVVDANEGQRAAPPAEMLRTGDFIIPTLNEDAYLKKPPLIYWMIAGVYTVTGVISPLTARIPTAITFVALILAVYLYARRSLGEMAARWGALAVMTAPYLVDRGRYAELDTPLTLATFLAIIAFWKACDARNGRDRTLFTVLSGVALGVGVMLKGPVPFLFLLPGWIAYLVAASPDRDAWLPRALRWTGVAFGIGVAVWLLELVAPSLAHTVSLPIALLLAAGLWSVFAWRHGGPSRGQALAVLLCVMGIGLALAAPWAVAVVARKGWPYVNTLIHTESLERTHWASRINSGSPFYYLYGFLGMAAPWSLLLPCQFSARWKETIARQRCLVTGCLSVLVFSLIAGKEYEYIMPALPFLLMAIGQQLAEAEGGLDAAWPARYAGWWRAVTPWLLAVLAVVFVVIAFGKNSGSGARFYTEVVLLTAATGALTLYAAKDARKRLGAISVMALCVVMLWTLSQDYRYTGKRSMKQISALAGQLVREGHRVEVVQPLPAFDFYAGIRVPEVPDEETLLARLKGADPYYCILSMELVDESSPALREQMTKPLVGPFGTKKLILIGNRPLPNLRKATS